MTGGPDWSDPLTQAAVGGAALLVLLVIVVAGAARRGRLARRIEALGQGQDRLIGALTQVAEAQVAGQDRMLDTMQVRLDRVQARMGEALGTQATRTADSLGALGQRIANIDRAQSRIEALSGEMLSLQDILSNKQARGAFGEIQMADILASALPPDAYTLQATLSTGRRADALIRFPGPPGPLAVDAKFPLESYEALRAATTETEHRRAEAAMRTAVTGHVRAVADRYILPGETADQALMFIPSEAVFAELHARVADVVRAGMEARVWIVSPSTLMAVLHTMRGVARDARLVAEAGRVRRELGALQGDLSRLTERVTALDRHFSQAQADLDGLRTSAEKAGRRAGRLETLDFDDAPAEAAPGPVSR